MTNGKGLPSMEKALGTPTNKEQKQKKKIRPRNFISLPERVTADYSCSYRFYFHPACFRLAPSFGAQFRTSQQLRPPTRSVTVPCRAWGSRPESRIFSSPDRAGLCLRRREPGRNPCCNPEHRRSACPVRPSPRSRCCAPSILPRCGRC